MGRQAREMARRWPTDHFWLWCHFFCHQVHAHMPSCGALTSERKYGVYSVSMPSRSGVSHRTHVKRLWSAWAGSWSTRGCAGSTKGGAALRLQDTLCGGNAAHPRADFSINADSGSPRPSRPILPYEVMFLTCILDI